MRVAEMPLVLCIQYTRRVGTCPIFTNAGPNLTKAWRILTERTATSTSRIFQNWGVSSHGRVYDFGLRRRVSCLRACYCVLAQ